MKRKITLYFSILILCLFSSIPSASTQILKDTVSLRLIKNGVDDIYDLRFSDAMEVYRQINRTYPNHPVVFLFKGMITYWENYPLLPSSPAKDSFEQDMRTCIELCESSPVPGNEAENLLANLCARGCLLLYYNANELTNEVWPLAVSTYPLIRRAFDFTESFPDFLYFTGLYNYYRDAYPDAYPVYKPLAILFPRGNREKGLADLQTAAKTSIELKAEAYSLLSWICIGFENNYQLAHSFSKTLHELYPANMLYTAEYIKNLLLIKNYDEAEELITLNIKEARNSYFLAQLKILNGIISEKKYKNPDKAFQYYSDGVRGISLSGVFGNEYAAYAYFGMARISEAKGEKNSSKTYHEKATRIARFKKLDFTN